MYNPNPKMWSHGCGLEEWPRFCGWVPLSAQSDGIFVPRPLVSLWRIWINLKIFCTRTRLQFRSNHVSRQ